MQVVEPVHDSFQREKHRAQAEDGEHVGRVNDEGVVRDGQHRGNGIHRENEVGAFEDQQYYEQRRGEKLSIPLHEETVALEFRRNVHEAVKQFQHRVPFGMNFLLLLHRHFDAAEDEQCAEP